MGFADLLSEKLSLVSVFGIIASLCFTAVSLRSEAKAQRIANLLAITANHREVWMEFLHNQDLARVLDASTDLSKEPLTEAEEVFVNLVISHISSVYYATEHGLLIKAEGLRRDVSELFSLPIPQAVWLKAKPLLNRDLADFIEDCLKSRTFQ